MWLLRNQNEMNWQSYHCPWNLGWLLDLPRHSDVNYLSCCHWHLHCSHFVSLKPAYLVFLLLSFWWCRLGKRMHLMTPWILCGKPSGTSSMHSVTMTQSLHWSGLILRTWLSFKLGHWRWTMTNTHGGFGGALTKQLWNFGYYWASSFPETK